MQTEYFNCTIQTSDNIARTVYFNPAKKHLHKMETAKAALQIINVQSSVKDGIESIIQSNDESIVQYLL